MQPPPTDDAHSAPNAKPRATHAALLPTVYCPPLNRVEACLSEAPKPHQSTAEAR